MSSHEIKHEHELNELECELSPPPPTTLTPSIRLLFSQLSSRHRFLLLLPAIFTSLFSGGIAPFMTFVVGQAFNAFAQFPLNPNPPQSAKTALLHNVGIAALELLALAFGSFALASLTSSLWIWTGERNVMALRKRVYTAVTQKEMAWFDTKMGVEGTVQSTNGEQGPLGAGGLMSKFTRETDDVRTASSLAAGMLLQHFTTCFTCLILAFTRSWSLTLVILSAVPLLSLVQGLSQSLASPLLASERSETATAATLVDRALISIATVKAFNAAPYEQRSLDEVLDRLNQTSKKINVVWGATSAASHFVTMAMFVQGFWFGSKLVRDGKIGAGDVMAVFWACLIATSNLQMCIPQFILLAKGKFAAVALLSLVQDSNTLTPTRIRKIIPQRNCTGDFSFSSISFAYPTRPSIPVLANVSLYLPARELTFIVGSSGSGKSTVAQLLLGMYQPQGGIILLDDTDLRYFNTTWVRGNVCGVGQGMGDVVLEGKSILENVAMGVEGATKEMVEEACRAALFHEFVRDLSDGYETILGGEGAGGVALSGGQKQRLAIARARLRNPSVLVLDEATSALDPTSRILVFEALKRWRQNKTTIVITHDLSQIEPQDFVYVLKDGMVVEQGFRYDLEAELGHDGEGIGEFRNMVEVQRRTGGFLPEKLSLDPSQENLCALLDADEEEEPEPKFNLTIKHQSLARPSLRPLTLGNWMFDVVSDFTATKPLVPGSAVVKATDAKRVSRFVPIAAEAFTSSMGDGTWRRPTSTQVLPFSPAPSAVTRPLSAHTVASQRFSLRFSSTVSNWSASRVAEEWDEEELRFENEKRVVEMSGSRAIGSREKGVRRHWDNVEIHPKNDAKYEQEDQFQRPAFWGILREIYPTIPYKPLLFLGLFICLANGAMTPVFSFLLSHLLFEVSTGAHNVSTINFFGGLVLGVAAFDGLLMGFKYFLMETAGNAWVLRIRRQGFANVLAQEKKWFDKRENTSVRLVQTLVKDGDDARNLVAVVMGEGCVVVAMVGVGLLWAMVRGWQLTLVGVGVAPVFAGMMALQAALVAKCELRNKRAREEVAKGYYDAIVNIRGIRAMSYEGVFERQFEFAIDKALFTGVRGAFVEGCTYGVASGLIYVAEALLFYVGAVLIVHGTYTYLQMVEVLTLVVFTVSIGSQLMTFTQRIAKSVQATSDFNRLLKLDTNTEESRGVLRPELVGPLTFTNVGFSYPERADAPVLKDINLEITEGECVAIVGPSGAGKSTIAALLQRLYQPDSGFISIGSNDIATMDVTHLRHHISVVSQNPNLFDATIAENIRYGNESMSEVDIRTAAKAANVHDFVMSLPQGYDTMLGENASLISGGQAQRLQIARALARPAKVLILDECTSSLDPANEAAVLETVMRNKVGRTTVMVTHKVPVMRMCDRVVVLVGGGVVGEQGTYEELMAGKGVFATLASGGEWVGE